jgi:DNA-binding protein YbaB
LESQGQDDAEQGTESSRASAGQAVGHGEAAGGMVRVTVSIDGSADAVVFDPRVARLPSEVLAEHTRDAMRAAHRQLLDRVGQDHKASTDEFRKNAAEMHEAFTHQLNLFQSMFDDIRRRRS